MVGCVIVKDGDAIGMGAHQRFGGDHAEVVALKRCDDPRGATAYVTLEPCSHHGKTPPCSQALVDAGIGRVVIATADPFPEVDGRGIAQLQAAGVDVEVGLLEDAALDLLAPYRKLTRTGVPWVIAKWAMTLDGKLATSSGSSQWISNSTCRQIVHQLRGRVDAILVGSATANQDDPLLTARPAGPRQATRIVIDSEASLAEESQLVRTASEVPVLIFVGPGTPSDKVSRLRDNGCEVVELVETDHSHRLAATLQELGRRRMTNVLVEGGGRMLGGLWDLGQVDEVHAFCATKLVGGSGPSPWDGQGVDSMQQALNLRNPEFQVVEDNVYIAGRVDRA